MEMNESGFFYVNGTELREKDAFSSLRKSDIIFISEGILNEQTVIPYKFADDIPVLQTADISHNDRMLMEKEAQTERSRLDEIAEEQAKRLAAALKYFSKDDRDISYAENLAFEVEKDYSTRILGEALQKNYLRYNDYPDMLAGICKILQNFELREVSPWGPTILMGMLNHKSETVLEYAAAVVEDWADTELLPVLRNLNCSSGWLKEYINSIVKYLEECNVLHKKII